MVTSTIQTNGECVSALILAHCSCLFPLARHYNYDLAACMGKSSTVALGYYPDWSQTESKCVKDANVPDYMRQKAATYIFDDIESCCKRFYNWEANKCIANSGGANAAGKVGTKKWYVDHSKGSCKQDNDGGAESWNHLYIR